MKNTTKQKRFPLAEEPREVGARVPSCPSDSRAALSRRDIKSPRSCGSVAQDGLLTFAVGLYIRVSTDRQAKEGDSLEEQESELKKFCEYRNFQIHKIYVERGKSGGNTNRPEYQKLVADLEAKKIQAIVVKKLDRLSRSLLDFEQLMTRLQANEAEFISLRENFDTTTAMGKAMLRIALIFAQLEREQTAERIKDVFSWRAEQGLYNGGTRPFGYDSLSSELIPHKQEKKIVQFIFNTFLDKKSTTAVARDCNAAGFLNRRGAAWDKRQIHKILIHPVYAGKIRWNGLLSEGIHQPLVTPSVYDQVQDIFKERLYQRAGNTIKGLLKGVLICGHCNGPMTPNYTKKKNKKLYYYYRCVQSLNPRLGQTSCKSYPRMEEVDTLVIQALLACTSESKMVEISHEIEQRNDKIQEQISVSHAEMEGFQKALEQIQKKKEIYLDSLISNTFSTQERGLINEKIAEFGLQEKRIKADLFKSQCAITELEEKILTLDQFKQELIFFKLNHETLILPKLQAWFKKNLTQIVYAKSSLKFHSKLLDLWIDPP